MRSAVLLAFFCASSALAAPTNLLTNGGFETGSAQPWQNAAGAQITSSAAHGGAYGVHLTAAQQLTQGWISVTPGKTYVAAIWCKWAAVGGSEWGYTNFGVTNSNWQTEAQVVALESRVAQNSWSKFAVTFVPRTDSVQIGFGVYGPKQTVDLMFDDAQLFEKTANSSPTIVPAASLLIGAAPLAVQFRAQADDADGAVAIYQWDFGDGALSDLPDPVHVFTARRSYPVRLTVWDNEGATASQPLTVQVTSDANPSVVVAQPTDQETFSTAAASLVLGGVAQAPNGRTIQAIVWDNVNTDEAGSVPVSSTATVNWSTTAIALKPGKNELLITATDSTGRVSTDRLVVTRTFAAPVISNIVASALSVRVYEKYELSFNLQSTAENSFFRYDPTPPAGVQAGTGVTVEGIFTAPSGATIHQPGFLAQEVITNTVDGYPHYIETGRSSWRIRFVPREVGNYSVTLHVQDASGTVDLPAPSFTAAMPLRRGFIRVSSADERYFEFSNGELFFPVGPANGPEYAQYEGSGLNFERPWMGGMAAYSTNWARWMRTDLKLGNEGFDSPLTFTDRYPAHEISRELFYPEGKRIWMGAFGDNNFFPDLLSGREYQIKLRLKTSGLAGPENSSLPYGFMLKTHGWPGPTIDADLRARPSLIPPISVDREWHTIVARYTATSQDQHAYLSLLLDNVTAGRVYLDQFSIREVLAGGELGGELIRHSKADMHTYVEQRPAAWFDRQVEQGEANDVFFKYVVQDKRDWIPNHLSSFGPFVALGDGYFQRDGTKAKWLQEQWWRYLVARWGYSPAVHSWESCNEASPDDTGVWRHTQEFARFLHQFPMRYQLATTSFWCCWKPAFWGDDVAYPDVDYADLHEYVSTPPLALDLAEFILDRSAATAAQSVGKPVILAETGISGDYDSYLRTPNPGVWYHNLLWAQLNGGSGLSAPNYWFSEHRSVIDLPAIARPFSRFVGKLDINRGGYVDAAAVVSNPLVRAVGQKHRSRNSAYLWVQNRRHNWHNVMGVENPQPITPESATIAVVLQPNARLELQRWSTRTGELLSTEPMVSGGDGRLTFSVSNLVDDLAVRIVGADKVGPQAPSNLSVQ